MAQTEMRMRLLRKNPKHKSGYEIVGHVSITNTYSLIDGAIPRYGTADNSIQVWDHPTFDAFELGKKHEDKWWYEGDVVEYGGNSYTLNSGQWHWLAIGRGCSTIAMSAYFWKNAARIGTIHDEEVG